jgi:hypothetical protein
VTSGRSSEAARGRLFCWLARLALVDTPRVRAVSVRRLRARRRALVLLLALRGVSGGAARPSRQRAFRAPRLAPHRNAAPARATTHPHPRGRVALGAHGHVVARRHVGQLVVHDVPAPVVCALARLVRPASRVVAAAARTARQRAPRCASRRARGGARGEAGGGQACERRTGRTSPSRWACCAPPPPTGSAPCSRSRPRRRPWCSACSLRRAVTPREVRAFLHSHRHRSSALWPPIPDPPRAASGAHAQSPDSLARTRAGALCRTAAARMKRTRSSGAAA